MAESKKTRFEEKTIKSNVFGEVVMGTNGEFNISNADLYKFYDEHGCPNSKEVIGALAKARGALIEESAKFLKPYVIERKERCVLNCGTGDNRVELTLNGKTTNTNPQTREEVVSYGKMTVKIQQKVPKEFTAEGGVLAKISSEIAKALK